MVRPAQKTKNREPSISLYIAAFFITVVIFTLGILVGKAIEQEALSSISARMDAMHIKTSFFEFLYLIEDSADFCPVYIEELASIDEETAKLGYKLSYLEEIKGAVDVETKKKYFILEAAAFVLSSKVKEKCNADYSTILYFYSNANCTDCQEQGKELSKIKQEFGEKVRIYSFDGDLGSPIVAAFKNKYRVSAYPSIVLNENETINGLRSKEWVVKKMGLRN